MKNSSPYVVVFTLWLLVFSSASQTMIISPILPQIGDDLDIADAVLGTLVTAYSLMVGLFAILSGPVSDRIGRRRILLAGCGVMTVALASHGLVDSYWSFLGVRVFAGMAGGVLSGAAVSYIGDYFPYDRRGWAVGWVMSGAAFGQIIGIPMGIVMAERWGFHSPFYLFAITMALTLPLLFFGVPQPPVKRTSERLTVSGAFADYVTLLKRPEVAWAAVAYFVMFFGVAVFVIYLPTWLERDLGASGDQIALMFLVGGIANVVTGPQAGKLSDRIGRKGIILLSCIGLSVLMLGTVPLVTNITIAYVFFFLTMVLVAMRVSPFSALLTGLVRDERRGSLMSLAVALGQLGFALGGAVSGPMFARVGYASNTVLGAVFVLGMGLVVWFFIPEPNLEAAPATAD
ncbi:MAG TPA: MFS transporter [Gemmatimonadetes bacterium]|nr:MFS transporter [Gemmatimonadota bacterium]HAC04653.1 MFS transporter [Gemmatimonadota bacterium]HBD97975.1 MFS transporter [Gemmatimonadota bacterium]HIC53177.1 MFS transporter [Gemmatimonadota bacterium]HIN49923.1 MFS transporter [Gemmatimonadota bacterium]